MVGLLPRSLPPMPSSFRQLDNAATPAEVVEIVRDYFVMWTPEEIALLPEACRPPHVRDETDVEELHRCAVEAFRTSRASGDELALLRKLVGFVASASVRLAQLRQAESGKRAGAATPRDRRAANRGG